MAGMAGMTGMEGRITRMVSVQWEMEPCIIECAQGGGTKKGSPDTKGFPDKKIEQVMGIEPTYLAWKASVLPLNYTRMFLCFFVSLKTRIIISHGFIKCNPFFQIFLIFLIIYNISHF